MDEALEPWMGVYFVRRLQRLLIVQLGAQLMADPILTWSGKRGLHHAFNLSGHPAVVIPIGQTRMAYR